MNARIAIALSLVILAGCRMPAPTTPAKSPLTAKGKASASPAGVPSGLSSVAPVGVAVTELIGKVKFISNGGGNIVGNNGGSIVSNNGGGIISDNGASYVTLQAGGASAVPEALLADAVIEVLDAAGNVLKDAQGSPITTTTDRTGSYRFKGTLPGGNLVLRVKLYQGGQLTAMLAADAATGARTLDIDTASTLGAAYVLDKYVKQQQAVFNKLPAFEAAKLQADMEAARVHMAEAVPAYQPEEMVAIAENLRAKAPQLDATLERIRALLVAGQSNLGNGLQAVQVSLGLPTGVIGDAEGNLYIVESAAGRIRKVAKDGTVSVFAGTGASAGAGVHLGLLPAAVRAPDGSITVLKQLTNQIARVAADGTLTVLAGNGELGVARVGTKATASPLAPMSLAYGPDGTLYIGDRGYLPPTDQQGAPTRILTLDAQGILREVEGARWEDEPRGLAVAPDGTIWVMLLHGSMLSLACKRPGAAWKDIPTDRRGDRYARLAVAPDGRVFMTTDTQILLVEPDGKLTPFAGTAVAGAAGDGGPAREAQFNYPSGLHVAPDGTIFVAEVGNALVRAIDPQGQVRTVAGVRGLTQVGDALTVAINNPGGMALDAQGRLLIAELGSHTIKRLDGNQLVTAAGSTAGFSGDGGPAIAAQFNTPAGLAMHQGLLYVVDSLNYRIRTIDAGGQVVTIAGGGIQAVSPPRVEALQAPMSLPFSIAVSPDGVPHWADISHHRVWRLKDGFVELVAGGPDDQPGDSGDGGPADKAELNRPTGLAFDKAGNLYVADTHNLRIRKITPAGIISTFAGMPPDQVIQAAVAGNIHGKNGDPATGTILWGPTSLCMAANGDLILGEAGTVNVGALGNTGALASVPAAMIPKTYARLRKITPDGKIHNLTGVGTNLLADPMGDNSLLQPSGVVFDQEGRLVIADNGLNQIKVLPKGSF